MMLIANRYEPTGAMSWGGMAEVHTCIDHHLKRHVVLKRVKNGSDLNRLRDELKSLLKVRSPHVVELLDVVNYDYCGIIETGLILEHIEGNDLSEGSFAYGQEYLKTLWQIAAGIADIHNAEVIHRDIKPGNIRRTVGGVCKVIDFGLSREPSIDDKTGSVIGSFGYIAPELVGPGVKEFSKAVDVYAFGATAVSLIIPVSQQRGPLGGPMIDNVLAKADDDLRAVVTACVQTDIVSRPKMANIRDLLKRKLLRSRHRAWIKVAGKLTEINSTSRVGSIKAGGNQIIVEYDYYDFSITSVTGSVYVNNRPAAVGQTVNSSCLLTFGEQGTSRAFVTFDVSHPEISA